jgi:hypothetical protein
MRDFLVPPLHEFSEFPIIQTMTIDYINDILSENSLTTAHCLPPMASPKRKKSAHFY